MVERVLGKDEVTSSILVNGSRFLNEQLDRVGKLGRASGAEGHQFNPGQRLQIFLKYFLYVLRSVPTGKHYLGIAADVAKRLNEHNTRTGRWTSPFKPWELVATEEYADRGAASRRERFLKSSAGIQARKELVAGKYGEGKIRSQQTAL